MAATNTLPCPWQATLEQLHLQMAQATFDSWLKGTYLLDQSNGVYQVAVKSEAAKDWLSNRLADRVTQTLTQIIGEPVTIEFVVADQHPHTPTPLHPHTPTSPPEFSVDAAPAFDAVTFTQEIDWRAKRNKNYTAADNYDLIFWQAWLDRQNSRAYGLWLAIQTFDKRNTFADDFHDWWTPPRNFRIRELAAIVGAGTSTPTLTGRMTNCARCENALDTGEPLADCCKMHGITRWKDLDYGERMCQYWRVGAFECLQNAGLLAAEVASGTTNSHQMRLQTWRLLPPLTPTQVNALPTILQIRHEQWLTETGHFYDLDQARWEQITLPSLVPHMAGHDPFRQLGTYTWNKILREQQKA